MQTMKTTQLYYNDVYIHFNQLVHIEKNALIKTLASLQKKTNFNFIVTDRVYPHTFLYTKKIDLVFATLNLCADKTTHYFCFSHHIMDGYSFIMFCIDFYALNGISQDKIINNPSNNNNDSSVFSFFATPKYPECAYNIYGLFKFIFNARLDFRSSSRITAAHAEPPPHAGPGIRINFRIPCLYPNNCDAGRTLSNDGKCTFNQRMCKVIEKVVVDLHLICGRPKFGIPINTASVDKRRKKYGNYVYLIADTSDLAFSKNFFIIYLLISLILICPLKMLAKSHLDYIVAFSLHQFDILYSNVDARMLKCSAKKNIYSYYSDYDLLNSSPDPNESADYPSRSESMCRTTSFMKNNNKRQDSLFKNISFCAPVLDQKLFTFSCVSLPECVDITIGSKVLTKTQMLTFSQKFIYECRNNNFAL
jgi:hypothetical protein